MAHRANFQFVGVIMMAKHEASDTRDDTLLEKKSPRRKTASSEHSDVLRDGTQ